MSTEQNPFYVLLPSDLCVCVRVSDLKAYVADDNCNTLLVMSNITLPKTNIQVAPENGWLEYYFHLGKPPFQVQTAVSFRETTRSFHVFFWTGTNSSTFCLWMVFHIKSPHSPLRSSWALFFSDSERSWGEGRCKDVLVTCPGNPAIVPFKRGWWK